MAVQLLRFATTKTEELSRLDGELQALATEAFAHVRGVPASRATAYSAVPEAIRDAVRAALGAGLFPNLPGSSVHPVDTRRRTETAHCDAPVPDWSDVSDTEELPLILRCKKARHHGTTQAPSRKEVPQSAGVGSREEFSLPEMLDDLDRIISGLDPDLPLDGGSRSTSLGVAGPAAARADPFAPVAHPAPSCQQADLKRGQAGGSGNPGSHSRRTADTEAGPLAAAKAIQTPAQVGLAYGVVPSAHADGADASGTCVAETNRPQQQRLDQQQQQDPQQRQQDYQQHQGQAAAQAAQQQGVQEISGLEPRHQVKQQHDEVPSGIAQQEQRVLQPRKRAPLWVYQLLPNRSRPKPAAADGPQPEAQGPPAGKRPRRQGAPASAAAPAAAAAAAAVPVQPGMAQSPELAVCAQQPVQDSSTFAAIEQQAQTQRQQPLPPPLQHRGMTRPADGEAAFGADVTQCRQPSELPERQAPTPAAAAAPADEPQRAPSMHSQIQSQLPPGLSFLECGGAFGRAEGQGVGQLGQHDAGLVGGVHLDAAALGARAGRRGVSSSSREEPGRGFAGPLEGVAGRPTAAATVRPAAAAAASGSAAGCKLQLPVSAAEFMPHGLELQQPEQHPQRLQPRHHGVQQQDEHQQPDAPQQEEQELSESGGEPALGVYETAAGACAAASRERAAATEARRRPGRSPSPAPLPEVASLVQEADSPPKRRRRKPKLSPQAQPADADAVATAAAAGGAYTDAPAAGGRGRGRGRGRADAGRQAKLAKAVVQGSPSKLKSPRRPRRTAALPERHGGRGQPQPYAAIPPWLQSVPEIEQTQGPDICAERHPGRGGNGVIAAQAEATSMPHTSSEPCIPVGAAQAGTAGKASGRASADVDAAGLGPPPAPAPAPAPQTAAQAADSRPVSGATGATDAASTEGSRKSPPKTKAAVAAAAAAALGGGGSKRQRPTPEVELADAAAATLEPVEQMDVPLAKRSGRRPQPLAPPAAQWGPQGQQPIATVSEGDGAAQAAEANAAKPVEAEAAVKAAEEAAEARAVEETPAKAAEAEAEAAVAKAAEEAAAKAGVEAAEEAAAQAKAASSEACAAAGVATSPELASAATGRRPQEPLGDEQAAAGFVTSSSVSDLAPPASVSEVQPQQPTPVFAGAPRGVEVSTGQPQPCAAGDFPAATAAVPDAAAAAASSVELVEASLLPPSELPARMHSAHEPMASTAASGAALSVASKPAAAAAAADVAATHSGTASVHAPARAASVATHGPPASGAAAASDAKPERRYKPVAPARRPAHARAAASDLPSTHAELAALAAAWMATQHGGSAGGDGHEGDTGPAAAAGTGTGAAPGSASDVAAAATATGPPVEAGGSADAATKAVPECAMAEGAVEAPPPAAGVRAGSQGAARQHSRDSAGMLSCTGKADGGVAGAALAGTASLPAGEAFPSHVSDPERGTCAAATAVEQSHAAVAAATAAPEAGAQAATAVVEAAAAVTATRTATAASEHLGHAGGSDFGEYAPRPQPPSDTATSPVRPPAPEAQDAMPEAVVEELGAAAAAMWRSGEPDIKGSEEERTGADGAAGGGDGELSRRNSSGCGSGSGGEGADGDVDGSGDRGADAGDGRTGRSPGAGGGRAGREQEEEEDVDAGVSAVEREEWRRRRAEIERQRAEAAAEREAARRTRIAAEAAAGATAALERRIRQRLADHHQLATAAAAEAAAKEDIRTRVRTGLQDRFRKALDEHNLTKLLRQLDVLPKGSSLRTAEQRGKALKAAKIRFHPDKVTGNLEERVYAEEVSKLLNSWSWSK